MEETPIAQYGRSGCLAGECDGNHYALGYCPKHYERFRDQGVVGDESFRPYGRKGCAAEACENDHSSQGYCQKHYARFRARGTVEDAPTVCNVSDCEARPYSRGTYVGLCRKHAERVRLHGTTDNPKPDLRERFLAKIKQDPTGCWLWTGSLNDEGYGRIMKSGRPHGSHRVAYELFVAPIPDGAELDHTCHSGDLTCPGGQPCRHRRCANPEHLEVVSPSENIRRSWANRKANSSRPSEGL